MKIARQLAPKYRFGFYDAADIEQEAIILGMEGMDRYEPGRPLENFLRVHMSNRLKSFKRDNFVRQEPPKGTEAWDEWNLKYASKKHLMEPIAIDNIKDENERRMWSKVDMLESLELDEISTLLDRHLPLEFRADYLRLMDGVNLPKPRREKIEQLVLDILAENGYETR